MEAREKLKEILKKGNVKHLDKLLKDLPPRSILSRVNEELDSDGTTPLIHCVKCAGVSFADSGTGFIDCCIYLIKHGAKVGTKDTHGKTPLFYAASNKNDRLGQTLLAAGADPFVKNQNGVSILGIAIQTGAIGTAKKIIEEFDTVFNEVDGTGCPPLILSLQLGNDDLCRFLLDKGADVNIQEERSHRTALHYALYMKKHEIFEKILSRNPNFELTDYKNTTIIHRASTIHDVQYLKSIFDSKMPPSSILLNLSDCDGANAVMLACQNGNFEHLKLLAEHGASVSSMDKCGRTALHHCVENTNTDCADFLLKKDTSLLNTPDNEGLTPLHMSAITGNEAMLHLLLKKGANLTCLDEEKHTVVHWATVSGQTEILDLLIEHGAELSTPDSHLAYPIHYAAQMAGRRSRPPVDGNQGTILKQLLDLKVDMSVMDKDGRQPLLWAASAGNVDACKTLVQAGADVEAKDKDGLTALHCAASRGHTSVIEELVSQCSANIDAVDKNMCTPLFYAITLGNIDSVKMLIQLGANTSHCDTKGRSPAHCAAIQGSQETLVLLQRKNVDLWLPSKQGDYPIHEAALGGHEGIVKFLLGLRSRSEVVKLANHDGRNCLHIAALLNNLNLCQLLLDSGADVNAIMRHKGKYYTPLDVATLKGHKEVELHLIYNGGRTGFFITNDAAIIIQRNFKLRKKFLRPNSPKVRVRLTTPTPVNDSEQEQDKNGDNNNDSGKIEDKRESKDSASSHICHNSVHVVINLPDQKQDLDEESDNKNNSKRDNKNYSKIDNKNYDKTDNKIDNDTAFKNFDETDHKSKNGYAYVPSRLVRNDTNKGCGCMCVPSKPAGSSTDKPGKHPNKTSMGTQPTKQRAEVKFENSPRHQTTDHRMTINKENNSEKQHQQKQQQHQHQQQHHYKQQQHQLQQQQKQQQYHQQQQAYSKPVSMQNGYIKGDVNRNAVPEGKSHQTELSLHIKKPLLRMGKSRRDIASDVQASVRRFEVERQAVRDYHQLKRAQMYTGPLYDIELVNKMVDKYHTEDLHSNAYQSSGHSEKNFSETSESMNDHQKNPDEISQDMTSLSDHQEEKDMKKTKSDKKLEMIVSRTEDLFNNLNKRVSGTLERAKTTNSRLRESLSSDKANRMIAQDKKEKIQEQRNQKYNEWRKQKAEELRQRLMKAYKPSYSRQQFSVSKGSSRSKRSDSPSRTSGSTSRPPTTQSYHSMPVAMPRYSSTTYSQRQRACSANPESYTTIMTRYGLRTIRKDSEPKVSWSCNSRDARTKQGLVFLPPDAYEEKVKQDKKKREEMIQEQELGQSTV